MVDACNKRTNEIKKANSKLLGFPVTSSAEKCASHAATRLHCDRFACLKFSKTVQILRFNTVKICPQAS